MRGKMKEQADRVSPSLKSPQRPSPPLTSQEVLSSAVSPPISAPHLCSEDPMQLRRMSLTPLESQCHLTQQLCIFSGQADHLRECVWICQKSRLISLGRTLVSQASAIPSLSSCIQVLFPGLRLHIISWSWLIVAQMTASSIYILFSHLPSEPLPEPRVVFAFNKSSLLMSPTSELQFHYCHL